MANCLINLLKILDAASHWQQLNRIAVTWSMRGLRYSPGDSRFRRTCILVLVRPKAEDAAPAFVTVPDQAALEISEALFSAC